MADAEPLHAALAAVIDPEIRRPITELDMVARAELGADGRASVALRLTIVGCPAAARIEREVREAVLAAPGVTSLELEIGVMTPAQRQALVERLRGANRVNPFGPGTLTRVLAITSGKGGVGKSTVTANLAIELARRGLAVGVVDADVHGFSIPRILGLVDADGQAVRPTRVGEMILPPVAEVGTVAGSDAPAVVKAISIGMFVQPGAAVAWRGPMLHRTLEQFLTEVWFGDLDVLLLDLPPGTGDIAISAGQLLPNAEVVVVTTPQPAAADVAVRSGSVARQTGQRVVGVIETMSRNGALDVFGEGGGAEVARQLSADDAAHGGQVPLLGTIPLSPELRAAGDAGRPLPADSPDAAAVAFRALAERLTASRASLAGRSLPLSPH